MSKLDNGQSEPNPINQDKDKQACKRKRKLAIGCVLAIILVGASFIFLLVETKQHVIPADKAVAISLFINSTSLLLFPLFKLLFPERKPYLIPASLYIAASLIWSLYMGIKVISPSILSWVKLICLPVVITAIAVFTELRQNHLDKIKKTNKPIDCADDKAEEQSSTTSNKSAETLRWLLIVLYTVEIGLTCWIALTTY